MASSTRPRCRRTLPNAQLAKPFADQTEWENLLSTFKVTGGDTVQLSKFYTAVYHAHTSPTTYNDANGDYLGFDKKIHNIGQVSIGRPHNHGPYLLC